MTVLKDDKFENAIRRRIDNMHSDFGYYSKGNVCEWRYINPLDKIWDLRINLKFEYVNKKIDENYEKELRGLVS